MYSVQCTMVTSSLGGATAQMQNVICNADRRPAREASAGAPWDHGAFAGLLVCQSDSELGARAQARVQGFSKLGREARLPRCGPSFAWSATKHEIDTTDSRRTLFRGGRICSPCSRDPRPRSPELCEWCIEGIARSVRGSWDLTLYPNRAGVEVDPGRGAPPPP